MHKLAQAVELGHLWAMSDLRRLMATKRLVRLVDGRTGIIVRIDTSFPDGEEEVELWLSEGPRPGLAKVRASSVIGAEQDVG